MRFHPGEYIRDELVARGKTVEDLESWTGLPIEELRAICAERAPITFDNAPLIGGMFGTGPEVWMTLQMAYDRCQEIEEAR